MDHPRLDVVHGPVGGADLILLAHGGQEHSFEHPHGRRPALLRMWPFVRAAHQAAPTAAVALARYRYRGWNGDNGHAMSDLRQLLEALPPTVGRIALIGHSMGGRAVMRCADDHRVVGVLALAPWLPEEEPLPEPADRLIVTAHGDLDQVTIPRATSRYVRRLRESGSSAAEFTIKGEVHSLFERHGDSEELVRRFARSCFGGAVDAAISAGDTADPAHPPNPLPVWSTQRGTPRALLGIARAHLLH